MNPLSYLLGFLVLAFAGGAWLGRREGAPWPQALGGGLACAVIVAGFILFLAAA